MKTIKLEYFLEVVEKSDIHRSGLNENKHISKKLYARIMECENEQKMKIAGWSSGPTGTAEKQGAPIAWYGDSLNISFVRLE